MCFYLCYSVLFSYEIGFTNLGWGGSLCFRSAKKGKDKDALSTAATVGGRDSAASSSTSSIPKRVGDSY